MDDSILTSILDAGGGLDHLRNVVLWFRRETGDYLFDVTKGEIIAALGTTSSTADRWSRNRDEMVSKLFTAENMRKLSEEYDIDYMGLLAAVGVVPADAYPGALPPFRFSDKKGGRRSPIQRPRP